MPIWFEQKAAEDLLLEKERKAESKPLVPERPDNSMIEPITQSDTGAVVVVDVKALAEVYPDLAEKWNADLSEDVEKDHEHDKEQEIEREKAEPGSVISMAFEGIRDPEGGDDGGFFAPTPDVGRQGGGEGPPGTPGGGAPGDDEPEAADDTGDEDDDEATAEAKAKDNAKDTDKATAKDKPKARTKAKGKAKADDEADAEAKPTAPKGKHDEGTE